MPFLLLRWMIALVLGAGGAGLLLECLQHHRPTVLLILGAAELLAAALFVLPRTLRLGGPALLLVLTAAAALHAASGETPPVSFLVYAAAIWAVMAAHRRSSVAP